MDNGLTVVTYDNGVSIYINYSESDITADGVTVPALAYQIVAGGVR